jgi:CheY-like chemotaxis protein
LEQAPQGQPAEDVRAAMRQSGDALLRLLEDVLDVSRMEAGRLSVETVAFDPRGPLERAVAMLRPIAAARDVRLRLEVASDVPAQISGDPARMQQVVANLLSNAAKFAPPGEVLVRAALSAGPAGEMLRIVVRDQGPDLAPAQRALLFRPFSRLLHATEGAVGDAPAGIGLGLSISRDLVTLMGGEIGCAAAPEGGNLFWFTLPLRPPLPPSRETSAARLRAAARPRPLPRQRVLLAEDVPGNRLVTAAMLRRDGHAVTAVADGAAAVVAAGSAPFDVVLMDLHLPGLDGVEATRRIRALPGSAGTVPVIGLTGEAEPARWVACREAGMDEVVVKPAGRAELLAAIARHVPVPHAAWASRDAAGETADLGTADATATSRRTGSALPPGPAAGRTEDAMLSARRLAELRGTLAPATLAEIAEDCLSELAAMTARLRQAQMAKDHAAVGSLAHAMAGLAGGYGLAAIERRMRAVLDALRGGNLAEAAAAVEGIEAELTRSTAGLRAALQIETV